MAIQPKSLEEFITKRKGSYEGSMIDVEGIPTPKAQPIAGAVDTLSNPDMQASPVQAAPLQSPDLSSLYESVQSQPSITEMEEQVEMGARSPAQSGDSNLWYFLPAALGALTCNIGEGSAASAGIIGDARKREQAQSDYDRTLSDKIKMLQLERKKSSAAKPVLVDRDGKAIYEDPTAAIGQQAFVKTGAESGKDERQIKAQEFTERMKMTERQNKAFEDFTKPKSPFSESNDNMKLTVSAMKQLNEGGPVAEAGLPSLIARGVFKEKGVLTEQDVQRVGGNQALLAQYNRTLSKAIKGEPLTDTDREDIKVLLKVGYTEEVERMKTQANRYIKARKALGTDVGDIINTFVEESIEPLPDLRPRVLPALQRSGGAKPIQSKPKMIRQNGVEYILNEKTGQYE